MSKDLTIAQFAQIALGKAEKPFHLGDLLGVYKEKVLPLKSTMAKLSKAQTFMFVVMLSRVNAQNVLGTTPSDVQSVISQGRSSIEAGQGGDFWAYWARAWLAGTQNMAVPGTVTPYQTLAARLKSVDASIFYLSPAIAFNQQWSTAPWVVIGILGTFGGLANLNAQFVPFWPGGWSDQDWTTITNFANSNDDLLLAPAELVPALGTAAQGQINNLPYADMLLLPGG
jgi:hypothetical protein